MGFFGRHVFAGTCGGVASILVCHPLDTIRTRLQTSGRPGTAWSCFESTVSEGGLRALYRGLLGPLMAQGLYKAIMFGVYGWAKGVLGSSRWELCAAGGLAGGVNALVLTPIELVRNRQQVSTAALGDVVRTVTRRAGVVSLWRGLGATLCRDVPGVGAYYLAFESFRGRTLGRNMVAGAVGGAAYWSVALPFDHVKSRLQVDDAATVSSILRTTPLARFYIGYGSALARGIPGAAIVFSVYAAVVDWV